MKIKPETVAFLKKLKKNNNKPWFDKNRPLYEEARANFMQFTDALIKQIGMFDPSVKHLTAKDCVFRIYKDVRFSKDKTPYKTHFGAAITRGGKKIFLGGYYFHLEPSDIFFAGGTYMPEGDVLGKIRQEIDYNRKEFLKLQQDKEFKKYFGKLSDEHKLKLVPKGYDKENPMLEYLKLKSFIVSHKITESKLLQQDFINQAGKVCKAMLPLNRFLNKALE